MRRQAVLVRRTALLIAIAAIAVSSFAQQQPQSLTINANQPVFTQGVPFTFMGTAPVGSTVQVQVGNTTVSAIADINGVWSVNWTEPLKTGTYPLTATSGGQSVSTVLRVQLPGLVQRQSPFPPPPPVYEPLETLHPEAAQEMTDRWRIAPPPYELDENPKARAIGKRGATLDPYNKNLLKGDFPIRGNDTFLVLTGVSDTLAESRTVPTPSGVAATEPASIGFFGKENQNLFVQNIALSADLFQGLTAFQPVRQRIKLTVIGNFTHVGVGETGIVKPDVRRGTTRDNGYVALQEIFYERKLKDLSTSYDFMSVRVGSQPFNSDFRGFIFTDTNLGVRFFGNLHSNRWQYNLAYFDRLEKDTNSGLNRITELRGQKVAVANFFMQDFLVHGYTQEFSVHYLDDDGRGELVYDRNGRLVRPAPVGFFKPHEIRAVYLGQAGLGHIGRINVDHALYYVFGTDSANPIAGPDPLLKGRGDEVKIGAGLAALEVSYDHDWWRPRLGFFATTGDSNPRDRRARGFSSIFESPNFAGGGFSFFNRLGIGLPPTGVSLVERGTLIPDLRSSKEEGQPNFVNPGVQIATAGLDVDVTPRLKTIFTANYIRLANTASIQQILFQGGISRNLGTDISLGARYRPFLNQNFIVIGGVAGFLPGQGFKEIYERDKTLYHVFTDVILTF